MSKATVILIVRLLAIALVTGAAIWSFYTYGSQRFEAGKLTERTGWQQRENTELAAANARIVALEDAARDQEQQHAKAQAAASKTYQENLQHEKSTRDRVIADLHSGALRLRIELARRETAAGDTAGSAGATTGRCDGDTTAELSRSAAEFLVGLTSEADEVVHQLTACQAVVTADRLINSQGEQ